MTGNKKTRRNFLITSMAVAGGIVGTSACQQLTNTTAQSPSENSSSTAQTPQDESISASEKPQAEMPQRVLGRTGVSVPILGLGGSASPLSRPPKEDHSSKHHLSRHHLSHNCYIFCVLKLFNVFGFCRVTWKRY